MSSATKKKSRPRPAKHADPPGPTHGPRHDPTHGPAEEKAVAAPDALPDREAVAAALAPVRAFAASSAQARVRGFLDRLAEQPPQVVLLEGGTAAERLAAAHYWAARLNCEGPGDGPTGSGLRAASVALPGLPGLSGFSDPKEIPDGSGENAGAREPAPCLDCSACLRMITHLHRDCFFFDGAAASIKIDEVRTLRGVLGEPPREARRRVVIFREAQALVEAAANALLKSLEEPRPATSFLLLAPQRERLLPTLVSRSFALTLPWPSGEDPDGREALASWEAALCAFLRTGRDFLEKSGAKGALDAPTAHALTSLCRRALVRCIAGRQDGVPPVEGLESLLALMPESRMRMLDEALAECQDSLVYGVNPVLAVEWLATRMYFLVPRDRRA